MTVPRLLLSASPLQSIGISGFRSEQPSERAQREAHTDNRHLITSATDRALRLLSCSPLTGTLTPSLRFQDSVNRTPWHAIGFSGDAEYVMGGAAHKAAHNVFIWDRESGVLIKVLEGPRDSLGDCHVRIDIRHPEQMGRARG